MSPYKMLRDRQYGVKALAAMGRKAEAIRYAEEGRGLNDSPVAIARACEEVLLSSGFADEAYERYGLVANRAGTYLAWFRAVAKKYPHKAKAEVLADLVEHTPGEEGKWFAAAKSAKLFDEAKARIREMVARETFGERFVTRVLGRYLEGGLMGREAYRELDETSRAAYFTVCESNKDAAGAGESSVWHDNFA